MATKYTNIFNCKTLHNLHKLGFLVLKICHLATLIWARNREKANNRCQQVNPEGWSPTLIRGVCRAEGAAAGPSGAARIRPGVILRISFG
jgi:hypothetical protein